MRLLIALAVWLVGGIVIGVLSFNGYDSIALILAAPYIIGCWMLGWRAAERRWPQDKQ